ncbi:MAG: hypothetical protein IJR32_03745 [Paludibacteraceae bacterium]|nr:hypothetical protein [Paludibacteraceae bacterium]
MEVLLTKKDVITLGYGILIFEVIPRSFRTYLSSETNESGENCESCEKSATHENHVG